MCDNARECEAAKRQGFGGREPEPAERGTDIRVRPGRDGDLPAILSVHRAAFETGAEATLVERLLAEGDAVVSLVAIENAVVVGHVLLSRVVVRSEAGEAPALSLAPVAVRPEAQRRGIGSRLVEESLAAAHAAGWGVVFVLGHPDYYPRFGFVPASGFGIRASWPDIPDEAWMVAELEPGALTGLRGTVIHSAAFDDAI
jgi:putative acetyltransferase